MDRPINAGKISQLPVSSMKQVIVESTEILIANVKGEIYAINSRCPHMKGDLSKGKLEGDIVTCPIHGTQINVTTGQVVRWLKGSGLLSAIGNIIKHPSEVKRYEVTVKGDEIYIQA